MGLFEKFQPLLAKIKSVKGRPVTEKYHALFFAALVAYFLTDLGLLYLRPNMLNTQAPPVKLTSVKRTAMQSLSQYSDITKRNIFNEDGKIPPPVGAEPGGADQIERPPVLSQLPLQLLGTIVHFNPKLSIATVTVSGKNTSNSYKVGEDIEGMANVTKIERKRLTFKNLQINRNEYIEIPDDDTLNFDVQTAGGSANLVEQRGKFDFSVKRSDFEDLTNPNNLNKVLMQARMEPVFSPDGVGVEGFRFVNIQTGSPFEKLGFKVGDMIKAVNGEAIDSPSKALTLFQTLKSSNHVQLSVDRDGREERFTFSIQ